MIMVLEGGNIYLRIIEYSDTENIVKWRNSHEVRKNFIYQDDFTAEGHMKWMHTMVEAGNVAQFIICDKESNVAIGSVFLRDIDKKNRKAEYGIFIGEKSYRGKGIGREAAALIIRYGFEELNLHKIFLRVFADNIPAIKSYERAGFKREAFLVDDVYIHSEYRDIVLMSIIND